jgi:hypothetical protein
LDVAAVFEVEGEAWAGVNVLFPLSEGTVSVSLPFVVDFPDLFAGWFCELELVEPEL